MWDVGMVEWVVVREVYELGTGLGMSTAEGWRIGDTRCRRYYRTRFRCFFVFI